MRLLFDSYIYQCGQCRVTCEFQLLVPQHMYIVIYIIYRYAWNTYHWVLGMYYQYLHVCLYSSLWYEVDETATPS